MKELTEYRRVSQYLSKLFDLINAKWFENEVSKPVITIQSTPDAYGHITCGKVWRTENGESRHELNIGAGTLSRNIENVVSTMIHEMVHLYCIQKKIKDTSRGYTYHNKKFKEEAEKRGLIIEHDRIYGWTITKPSDELFEWCIEENLENIKLHRIDGYIPTDTGNENGEDTPNDETPVIKPKKQTTWKYTCPVCKCSCRATKKIHLICGDCKEEMTEEER